MVLHQISSFGYFSDVNKRPYFRNLLVVRQGEFLKSQMRVLLSCPFIPELYLLEFADCYLAECFYISIDPDYIENLSFAFELICCVQVREFPHVIPYVEHIFSIVAWLFFLLSLLWSHHVSKTGVFFFVLIKFSFLNMPRLDDFALQNRLKSRVWRVFTHFEGEVFYLFILQMVFKVIHIVSHCHPNPIRLMIYS